MVGKVEANENVLKRENKRTRRREGGREGRKEGRRTLEEGKKEEGK